jgi:tetratricopeptide (TPR) repeat protein
VTDPESAAPADAKRCFVVMGFGVKTDYATGRKLDLNKSYRLLIKPAVEEKGLVCVRADEIRHSGAIDVPMYQELLTADVVIADLSTANPNALYELGIRHALRPRTTIVISENKLPYPFDLNHISILGYSHLGDAIDYEEVMGFRQKLKETLEAVLKQDNPDSPIYTFLQDLNPPSRRPQTEAAVAQAGAALERMGRAIAADVGDAPPNPSQAKTLALIIEQGEDAIQRSDFATAKACFGTALQLCKSGHPSGVPQDSYLVHRLVLATYKAELPDQLSAAKEAMALLAHLDLEESNDPETVGLAGAIEKRMFENGQGTEHLARAINYYARGYFLRSDRYNGINLAFLLNLRPDTDLDPTTEEKIADLVWAKRLRREILMICDKELQGVERRAEHVSGQPGLIATDQQARNNELKFWIFATKAEAHLGLGEPEAYVNARSAALALNPPAWMIQSMDKQIASLQKLLEKHAHLLGSPQSR